MRADHLPGEPTVRELATRPPATVDGVHSPEHHQGLAILALGQEELRALGEEKKAEGDQETGQGAEHHKHAPRVELVVPPLPACGGTKR